MTTETVASTRTAYHVLTDEEFLITPPTYSESDALQGFRRVSGLREWFAALSDRKTVVFMRGSLQVQEHALPLNPHIIMWHGQTATLENASLQEYQEYQKEHIKLFTRPNPDTWMWTSVTAQPTAIAPDEAPPQDALRASLMNRLWAAFEAEALEDGVSHPAEDAIAEALDELGNPRALECFRDISLDVDNPGFAASTLRCLGRQAGLGTQEWRVGLVQAALATDDVEIRDAAAQAAESWGDWEMVAALEAHHEPVVWLKDYIDAIVDDMRA